MSTMNTVPAPYRVKQIQPIETSLKFRKDDFFIVMDLNMFIDKTKATTNQ